MQRVHISDDSGNRKLQSCDLSNFALGFCERFDTATPKVVVMFLFVADIYYSQMFIPAWQFRCQLNWRVAFQFICLFYHIVNRKLLL